MTITKAELYEEIRALLREPQASTVDTPWFYDDDALTIQVRSALRHLRVLGLATGIDLTPDGVFNTDPEESLGVLLALYVSSSLLTGDLVRKLADGELGIYLNAGGDVIDTKTATIAFKETANGYQQRFEMMLTVVLTASTDEASSVYSGPTA